MKIKFHSPITLEGKPSSEAQQHAEQAVQHAKEALKAAGIKLDAAKRPTKVLYNVRKRMQQQIQRVANSLRED